MPRVGQCYRDQGAEEMGGKQMRGGGITVHNIMTANVVLCTQATMTTGVEQANSDAATPTADDEATNARK